MEMKLTVESYPASKTTKDPLHGLPSKFLIGYGRALSRAPQARNSWEYFPEKFWKFDNRKKSGPKFISGEMRCNIGNLTFFMLIQSVFIRTY